LNDAELLSGDDDLGPLFSPAGAQTVPGLAPAEASFALPAPETCPELLPDRAALDRYLRLCGVTLLPRPVQVAGKAPAGPAWVETLSNGRFLVCELGLRWHLAGTRAEAAGILETLRLQDLQPDPLTPEWMEERAERFRQNPSAGVLTLRALLEGLGLDFREQAVLGWRVADVLIEGRLVVEVDDETRRARKTRMDGRCRDEDLLRAGFLVLRLNERDLAAPAAVERQLGAILDDLSVMAQERPSLPAATAPGAAERNVVSIYTDGGCSPNPGKGGYGVILSSQGRQKELSGGFRETTNNRMEIFAAIAGLEALKRPGSVVTVYSDSRYLVDAITKGWARKWQRNGWMRTPLEKARNADLWARLLVACARHKVSFEWVRGHVGHPENERCDQLAGAALKAADLADDPGFPGL
jgi:ribonuclease HI